MSNICHFSDSDPSMGPILSRNNDLPDHLKEMVAPDTYDGYEGVNIEELEDDANFDDKEDVWRWRNLDIDLFEPTVYNALKLGLKWNLFGGCFRLETAQ